MQSSGYLYWLIHKFRFATYKGEMLLFLLNGVAFLISLLGTSFRLTVLAFGLSIVALMFFLFTYLLYRDETDP